MQALRGLPLKIDSNDSDANELKQKLSTSLPCIRHIPEHASPYIIDNSHVMRGGNSVVCFGQDTIRNTTVAVKESPIEDEFSIKKIENFYQVIALLKMPPFIPSVLLPNDMFALTKGVREGRILTGTTNLRFIEVYPVAEKYNFSVSPMSVFADLYKLSHALLEMHSRNCAHLDIKKDNILKISDTNEVMWSDFGEAKIYRPAGTRGGRASFTLSTTINLILEDRFVQNLFIQSEQDIRFDPAPLNTDGFYHLLTHEVPEYLAPVIDQLLFGIMVKSLPVPLHEIKRPSLLKIQPGNTVSTCGKQMIIHAIAKLCSHWQSVGLIKDRASVFTMIRYETLHSTLRPSEYLTKNLLEFKHLMWEMKSIPSV